MKTSNAMQLKARIRNKAKDAGIPAQALLQNYLLERLLERLSLSRWSKSVVVKGGLLIASYVGVASRTTMDLDTTIMGFSLTHESARSVFEEIASVEVDDDWRFELDRVEDIRETDDYPGVRVFLLANYSPMSVPLVVDVTTGDRITPGPVEYAYPRLFDDGCILLMSYPLETLLAEKLETIVSRGVFSTRPRDFYDIHTLWSLKSECCSVKTLRDAVKATSGKRKSLDRMVRGPSVLNAIETDQTMLALWNKYVKKNPYASGISLQQCCETMREIFEAIERVGGFDEGQGDRGIE